MRPARVAAVLVALACASCHRSHGGSWLAIDDDSTEQPDPMVEHQAALETVPAFTPTAFTVEVFGQGRPVILIPGLGCPGAVWNRVVAHLENHYEVHVLTLAGFAGVPAIDAPLGATARAQLATYIRAEHLDHPIIIGHSMGGFIAYWLAETDPDLVGPTIIVDAGAALGGDDHDANIATGKQARDMWANADDAQFTALVRQIFSDMATDNDRLGPILEMVGKSDRRVLGDAIAEMYSTDLRPQLSKIVAPVLVVLADGSLADQYRAHAALVHGSQVIVVPHTRHFVFLDDPQSFFTAVDAFLDAHPAATVPTQVAAAD